MRAQGIASDKPEALSSPRDDKRRFLIDVFAEAIEINKPKAFIFENVASILHPRNRSMFFNLVDRLEDAGYSVNYEKFSALSFGLAQKRERVFIIGRKGKHKPVFGNPSHRSSEKDTEDLLPTQVVSKVLDGIEFEDERGIHVEGKWADALKEIPPGWNYKALTEWAGHPKPLFEAETRFWNFLLKLSPDLPSWTIASQPGPWTGPFHWDSRRLTTKEMAVIQGFPKNYQFCGSRRERVRQIGNAVPPPFVAGVARPLLESL